MLSTVGALLPRDFLERQPKRWQKSQRKRRVLPLLRKMKTKREKVEDREMKKRIRDDLGEIPQAPVVPAAAVAMGEVATDSAPKKSSRRDEHSAASSDAPGSSSTPFGPNPRGLWAAQLVPNRVLLVKIPEDVQLSLLRASIAPAVASDGAASDGAAERSAVRCRTPKKKLPVTLCYLQPQQLESCMLGATFCGTRDRACAIGVEGRDTVHLVGHYTRSAPLAASSAAAPAPAPRPARAPEPLPKPPPQPTPKSAPTPKPAAPAAPAAAALVQLDDGLKYVDIKVGGGRKAARGQKLTVKYKGVCADRAGTWGEFDSNGGKPFHFTLGAGEVIRGWDVGVAGMRCGGTRRLVVPPGLGYGERGAGPVLPSSTLIFELTLLNSVGGGPAKEEKS